MYPVLHPILSETGSTIRMIRILHFASVINRYDFIDTVLTDLDRSRFDLSALTVVPAANRKGEYSDLERYDSRCLNIEFTRRNFPRIYSELKKEIKRFRPHILQTHHFDETLMGTAAAKLLGVPALVIGHHYSNLIYVLTKGLKRSAYLQLESVCNYFADRIVVPTQEVVDVLQNQGVKRAKIAKIAYGTNLDMLQGTSTENLQAIRSKFYLEGKFVALTCCRLDKAKGIDYVLRALPEIAAKYPSFQLVIVGTGPEEERLRQIREELKLEETVQFIGWRTDALDWYSAADVVIQPSFSESFCQVVTEALALKRPVIVTSVGVAPEIIVTGERGGYLIPFADSKAIVAAISKLIESPELGPRLADSGHAYVNDSMSAEITAKKYEDLYLQIIAEKGINTAE